MIIKLCLPTCGLTRLSTLMEIKLLSLSPFLKEKAHFLQGIYIINIGSVSSIKHCIIWQFLSGQKALWVYWPLSPSQTWLVATHWAPPTQRRCPAGQWITVQDRSSVPSPQSSSPSQIQPAWIQRPVPQVNSCKHPPQKNDFLSWKTMSCWDCLIKPLPRFLLLERK